MASVAETKRLYYDSATLEFEAAVNDLRPDQRAPGEPRWQVALDRTAFYPEGGGQPWDTGRLTTTAEDTAPFEVFVERVEEDEAGRIWHSVPVPIALGTALTGKVDFERRVDHEQQHSGQHLLSAMFLQEVGARTVSFHMGKESSTIDLSLRDGMERLSAEELARVEEAANRVVYEGRPLMAHWIQREMAELMLVRGDLRKLPEREGPLRIVQMQGIEFNACGGTHVANTGSIGAVVLRRVEKVKQGWRVEFCCGLRAVRAARLDFALLRQTAGLLSVGAKDIPMRVEKLLADAKAAAKELKKANQNRGA